MNHLQKIILFWLLLIVCMILHFNYHVSGIFYGVDVTMPNAAGKVPNSILIIRSLFHFLPLLYVIALTYYDNQKIRVANLVLSMIYASANLMHMIGEIAGKKEDLSQIMLLLITLFIFILLSHTSWLWNKEILHQSN